MPRKIGVRNERFARWFARARREARLTQEAVAERLNVSQGAITNWERDGVETMTPAMIRRVARVFEVAPADVAEALGYPVVETARARAAALRDAAAQGEGDPVFIATEIARLSSLLAELLAEETAAENGDALGRSGRARG